jgi:hypothetical protein
MVPQKTEQASLKPAQKLEWGTAERVFRPGASARLRALLRSASLDEALIAGADPAASRPLAARAYTLTSLRFRDALASGLERWLEAADGRTSRQRVLPQRALAVASAPDVREVVATLLGSAPLYARGIASIARLFGDGSGPAYAGDGELLAERLEEARAALSGRGRDAIAAGSLPPALRAPRASA